MQNMTHLQRQLPLRTGRALIDFYKTLLGDTAEVPISPCPQLARSPFQDPEGEQELPFLADTTVQVCGDWKHKLHLSMHSFHCQPK